MAHCVQKVANPCCIETTVVVIGIFRRTRVAIFLIFFSSLTPRWHVARHLKTNIQKSMKPYTQKCRGVTRRSHAAHAPCRDTCVIGFKYFRFQMACHVRRTTLGWKWPHCQCLALSLVTGRMTVPRAVAPCTGMMTVLTVQGQFPRSWISGRVPFAHGTWLTAHWATLVLNLFNTTDLQFSAPDEPNNPHMAITWSSYNPI